MPGRRSWSELRPDEKKLIGAAGAVQITLMVLALRDIWKRPPSSIRGSRGAWTAASFVNFVGPITYFLFGRRR